MSSKACCPNCFGDSGLSENIIPSLLSIPRDASSGNCSYCGVWSDMLVPPIALRQWFEMLLEVYKVDESGTAIIPLLKRDWQIFGSLDDAYAKELLADILDDGQLVRKLFTSSDVHAGVSLQRWDTLRTEMMHENRWFPANPIDLERLLQLLAFLVLAGDSLPTKWHRARLMSDEEPFEASAMGAPPQRRAGHGRANPAGIRYLYLGSDVQTAVAEVRPHAGAEVSVASFEIPRVRVVDLRAPRSRISPFVLTDAEEISLLRADLPLLERLGEELSKPVLPHSAAFEYIPSQFLCEYIKKCGFAGVLYSSSVGKGVNLALFDPDQATISVVEQYRVESVDVAIRRR